MLIMPFIDFENPCLGVAKLIEVINQRKPISWRKLSTLRVHLTIFPECKRLLNEQGDKILRGEDPEYKCSEEQTDL